MSQNHYAPMAVLLRLGNKASKKLVALPCLTMPSHALLFMEAGLAHPCMLTECQILL